MTPVTAGLAVGTMPGVLLDTNVYRSMPEARFTALSEAERRRQVAQYAEPFSLQELLAHLADPRDPEFAWCRQAVVRVYRRVSGEGRPCGIIRDTESRLAEAITGKGLEKHDAYTEQLCIMLERVARTPLDQPLSKEETIRLPAIAEHVAAVEAGFADSLRRMQQTIDGILGEDGPEERRQTRRNAMATHASEERRMMIAEGLLRFVCGEAGLALSEPLPVELVARVRTGAAAGIEFEAQLLRRAAFDGANVDAPRIRNLRWDQRIAYNIGWTIGPRPLWLVTDDGAFAEVARATGPRGPRAHGGGVRAVARRGAGHVGTLVGAGGRTGRPFAFQPAAGRSA